MSLTKKSASKKAKVATTPTTLTTTKTIKSNSKSNSKKSTSGKTSNKVTTTTSPPKPGKSKAASPKFHPYCKTVTLLASLFAVLLIASMLLYWLFGKSQTSDSDKNLSSEKGYNYLWTKTMYLEGRKEIERKFNQSDLHLDIPATCEPVFLYFLGRHGIRFPRDKEIQAFRKIIVKIKAKLEANKGAFKGNVTARDAILQCKFTMQSSDSMLLSESGAEQTRILAARIYSIFPSILNVNETKHTVVHSERDRTKATAAAFVDGIFKANGMKPSKEEIQERFPMIEDNRITMADGKLKPKSKGPSMKDMGEGVTGKQMAKKLNARFGLKDDQKVSFDDLYHVYQYCAYDLALNGHSHWCELFTSADLQLMEYMVDTMDYWKKYINLAQYVGPIIMHDVYTLLERAFQKNMSPEKAVIKSSVLYFSHDTVLRPLIVYLEQFPPYPNSTQVPPNLERQWHGGTAMPFNANFAASLYRCSQEDGSKTFKMATFYNEVPLLIPGCNEKLCDFEEFSQKYKDVKPVKPEI